MRATDHTMSMDNKGKRIRGMLKMEMTRGVRKGAWTYEEDKLLKTCINKYGEGKWHLVPQRAGLMNVICSRLTIS